MGPKATQLSDAGMKRYFLNVRTMDSLLVDEEGDEFPDIGEVCKYAVHVAAELAREYPPQPGNRWTIVPLALEVMDHTGALVYRAPVQ